MSSNDSYIKKLRERREKQNARLVNRKAGYNKESVVIKKVINQKESKPKKDFSKTLDNIVYTLEHIFSHVSIIKTVAPVIAFFIIMIVSQTVLTEFTDINVTGSGPSTAVKDRLAEMDDQLEVIEEPVEEVIEEVDDNPIGYNQNASGFTDQLYLQDMGSILFGGMNFLIMWGMLLVGFLVVKGFRRGMY